MAETRKEEIMASRDTKEKAIELKQKLEARHPSITLRILESSEERRIGRAIAERKGYEITEDSGGVMVTVNLTEYNIVEVRKCRCGAEITTIAIGEHGLDECANCEAAREERDSAAIKAGIKAQKAAVDAAAWRSEWEED